MSQKKLKKEVRPFSVKEQRAILCERVSFAASESYKLLRTNLLFSLVDEQGCRTIGVSSALQAEGKTTTAINIAYTLAETGKRVLLMEADMRLPTIAKKMALSSKPGLSNVLAGLCTLDDVIQDTGLYDGFKIICAGDIPANPAELLGSDRMTRIMEDLSTQFDFIVVDLPPINAVADGLVISRLIQGMVVVVRKDFGIKKELAKMMQRLEYLQIKVLGFVMTHGTSDAKKKYKSKYYGYGYGYGYGHAQSIDSTKQ